VTSRPQVLGPVGDTLTREASTPPLGDPGTDTTHERAITRGEPRAWYGRKEDTPPGQVISDWGACVGTQKVNPRDRSTS